MKTKGVCGTVAVGAQRSKEFLNMTQWFSNQCRKLVLTSDKSFRQSKSRVSVYNVQSDTLAAGNWILGMCPITNPDDLYDYFWKIQVDSSYCERVEIAVTLLIQWVIRHWCCWGTPGVVNDVRPTWAGTMDAVNRVVGHNPPTQQRTGAHLMDPGKQESLGLVGRSL